MSIIKSNGANILIARTDVLKSMPMLKSLGDNLDNHHDMLGQELHLYDWVVVVTLSEGTVIKRIGFVINFSPKKVTIMTQSLRRGEISKSSIGSDRLIKISESTISELKNYVNNI